MVLCIPEYHRSYCFALYHKILHCNIWYSIIWYCNTHHKKRSLEVGSVSTSALTWTLNGCFHESLQSHSDWVGADVKYVLYNEHVYGSIPMVSYTAPGERRVIRAMETLPQSRHFVRKKDLSYSQFLFRVPQRLRCRLNLGRWDQSGTDLWISPVFRATRPPSVSPSASAHSWLSLFCDDDAVTGQH